MRNILLLTAVTAISLMSCTAYGVIDGAYVDNKVYLAMSRVGGGPADFFVTQCTPDANANLNCKRVNVTTK